MRLFSPYSSLPFEKSGFYRRFTVFLLARKAFRRGHSVCSCLHRQITVDNNSNGVGFNKDPKFCCWHENSSSEYACDICENFFCKTCPKSFGGSVKLCPLCGSMCRKVDEAAGFLRAVGAIRKPYMQMEELTSENQSRKQKSSHIPGFGKTPGGAARYYKKLLLQKLFSRFSSARIKERFK